MSRALTLMLLAVLAASGACSRRGSPEPKPSQTTPAAAAPTNRVDVPSSVRQNLGITFAKVERRPVGRTLRVPGRFELAPTARREYRAAAPGRVELLVEQ